MSEASQDLIPMNIAKAMKLIVATKQNEGRPNLQQVLCESYMNTYDNSTEARFVGTNGHVMLIVDTKLPPPEDDYSVSAAPEPGGKIATSDLAKFIDSKGHRKPEFFRVRDRVLPEFPDYKQVIHESKEAVERIGFDVSYMDMMLKIHKALKLGSSQTWSVSFEGTCGPATWWPEMTCSDDDPIRGVTFIVMPVRLG